jgi:hypothetical protein
MNTQEPSIEATLWPERLRLRYLTEADYSYLLVLKEQCNGNQTAPITLENTLFRRLLAEVRAVHDGTE